MNLEFAAHSGVQKPKERNKVRLAGAVRTDEHVEIAHWQVATLPDGLETLQRELGQLQHAEILSEMLRLAKVIVCSLLQSGRGVPFP
jgi:hypothetical protein